MSRLDICDVALVSHVENIKALSTRSTASYHRCYPIERLRLPDGNDGKSTGSWLYCG